MKYFDFIYRPFSRWIPKQLFLYAFCGGANMVFDWVLYFLMYNFVIGHDLVYIPCPLPLNILPSTLCLTPHIATLCIVFPITLLTGFLLQKYVTFRTSSDNPEHRTSNTFHRQLGRYTLIVAVNLAINYFGLKLCVETFGWYPTPSKMLITLFTVAVSYLGQKYYTFRNARSARSHPDQSVPNAR